MRPIAIGKFRKPEKPNGTSPQIGRLSRCEPHLESDWDAAMARRVIAIRRWRGIATLPCKVTLSASHPATR